MSEWLDNNGIIMTTIINMLFNNSMPHVYKLFQEYLELQKEKKEALKTMHSICSCIQLN